MLYTLFLVYNEIMIRRVMTVFILLLAIPISTYAATAEELKIQITELFAKIAELEQILEVKQSTESIQNGQEICSTVYGRSLSRGMRGNDVRILQRFLKQQTFFDAEDTGYFGAITETSLTEFQLAYKVITTASQGGVFGPRTRAYVNSVWCTELDTQQSTTPPPACINPSQPTLACDGNWEKFFNQNQCHIGWTCVVAQPVAPVINKAPIISAVVGTTLLKANESGVWTITATDPENDTLTYSVVWGDEGANIATLLNISQQGTPYSSATSISHSYKNTGAYTIVVFAKDVAGNTVKATLSINVYESPPPPPPPPPPVQPAKSTSCTLLGRTFPPGTIIPFSPLLSWLPHAGTLPTKAMMPVMSCAMNCGGQWVRYRCENGDWVRIDSYPYPYPYPIALKPVIYFYPPKATGVVVELHYKGKLAHTYPDYDETLGGWRVTAHPDGTLFDARDGKEYSYLFWEGEEYQIPIDETKGFVVKGSDTKAFLQEKLAELGLTPREYNEFIVFWLPRMEKNTYNFIQFVGKEYEESAPLSITPKPDSILRVFMAFRPLDIYKEVTPQEIKPFVRKGFTVVEWGGTELSRQ